MHIAVEPMHNGLMHPEMLSEGFRGSGGLASHERTRLPHVWPCLMLVAKPGAVTVQMAHQRPCCSATSDKHCSQPLQRCVQGQLRGECQHAEREGPDRTAAFCEIAVAVTSELPHSAGMCTAATKWATTACCTWARTTSRWPTGTATRTMSTARTHKAAMGRMLHLVQGAPLLRRCTTVCCLNADVC